MILLHNTNISLFCCSNLWSFTCFLFVLLGFAAATVLCLWLCSPDPNKLVSRARWSIWSKKQVSIVWGCGFGLGYMIKYQFMVWESTSAFGLFQELVSWTRWSFGLCLVAADSFGRKYQVCCFVILQSIVASCLLDWRCLLTGIRDSHNLCLNWSNFFVLWID